MMSSLEIEVDSVRLDKYYTCQSIVKKFRTYTRFYILPKTESGFASDKKSNGWNVWQKRFDRIATAVMCKGIWHNLLVLRRG